MDKNYKKILILLTFSALVIVIMLFVNFVTSPKHGKVITLTILNADDSVVYEGKGETMKTGLSDFMIELNAREKIKMRYGGDENGMRITGLGEETLILERVDDNLIWEYESPNNVQCLENEECGPMEQLVIEDGDEFIFKLTKEE